jgi:hypothetical protein
VETLGGLRGCSRFYARRLFGGDLQVFAATPRNRYPPNTFAVFGGNGWTTYDFVQVVVDRGRYRVQTPTANLRAILRYLAHPGPQRVYTGGVVTSP